MNEKNIYNMELHEQIQLRDSMTILRVPGGWLYLKYLGNVHGQIESSTFVPLNYEFNSEPFQFHAVLSPGTDNG